MTGIQDEIRRIQLEARIRAIGKPVTPPVGWAANDNPTADRDGWRVIERLSRLIRKMDSDK